MGAVTMERPTAEAVAQLDEQELRGILGDDEAADELRELASDELRKRVEKEPTAKGETPATVPEDAMPDLPEIEGTVQLGLFDAGGKRPTGSSLTLTGGKVSLVNGEAFKKGDRIRLTIEAVVNSVAQKDDHDPKTGQVRSCEQRHGARIIDIQLESGSAA